MDIAVPVQLEAHCRLRGRVRPRFTEPAAESAYRRWRVERAIPFARVAMNASIIGWLVFLAASLLIGPDLSHLVVPAVVVIAIPLVGAVLTSTYRERWHGFVLPSATIANAVSGTVAILILERASQIGAEPTYADVGTAVAVLFVYYGCTIVRLPPGLATAAIAPYVLLQELFLWRAYAGDPARQVAFTGVIAVAVVSGLLLSAALERVWRDTFEQEQLIEAQQRVIEAERERSEKLLHSILPVSVAEELKVRPGTIAEAYEQATVLFADVVGFTPMSSDLSATELITMLNRVFSRFDELCRTHGVEKIKTIGDAYMAVAGVPEPRQDHAEACANLALAMRDAVRELAGELGRPLDFRIGMHSGPVVAGVIGTSKFAYDLWGDTVNTAARMESHGLPGEIQISDELAARLRARGYGVRERGEIEVKGKGTLRTWLLESAPVPRSRGVSSLRV